MKEVLASWIPTKLATRFHKIPHWDCYLNNVKAVFNPRNCKYLFALKLIAAFPILLSLLLALLLFLLMLAKMHANDTLNPKCRVVCLCIVQSRVRWLMFAIVLLLIMLILLEYCLHSAVKRGIPPLRIQSENLIIRDYRIRFSNKANYTVHEIKKKYAEENKSIPKTIVATTPAGDIRYIINSSYAKIEDTCETNLNRTLMEKRNLWTPRQLVYVRYEYIRYIICMMIWLIMLLCCLLRFYGLTNSTISYGICGLIVCGICMGYLLAFAVALGDACQNPDLILSSVRITKQQEDFLESQYEFICKTYIYRLKRKVMECRKSFLDLQRFSLKSYYKEHATNVSVNYRTDDTWKDWYYQKYRAKLWYNLYDAVKEKLPVNDSKGTNLTNIAWNYTVNCDNSTTRGYSDFAMDATKMCTDDNILIWLLLQMIVLGVISILFFIVGYLSVRKILKKLSYVKTRISLMTTKHKKTCKDPDCIRDRFCHCLGQIHDAAYSKLMASRKTWEKPVVCDIDNQSIQQKTSCTDPCSNLSEVETYLDSERKAANWKPLPCRKIELCSD